MVRRSGRATAVAAAAVVCVLALAPPAPASSQDREFASPSVDVRPKLRWWWVGGTVDPAEIRREVDQMADAGFGGFEIADVWDTVTTPIDPVEFGYGTPRWNRAVEAALDQAKHRGLTADLTIGPHWPSTVPTITPDSPAAAKEIVHGEQVVAGGTTFDGPLPEPAATPGRDVHARSLIAVQAFRCTAACTGDSPAVMVPDSRIDLTDQVTNGRLRWTAPAGTWILLPSWYRGTGQIQRIYDFRPGNSPMTSPQAYVVDHFSKAGAKAVTAYWESTLLTPKIRSLLRDVGGAIFEDSLELNTQGHWTPDFLREFRQRRGYSLRGFLPAVFGADEPEFTFTDGRAERVRHDYEQTLSDLYIDDRVETLKKFTRSIGLEFRNQPYGAPVDVAEAAARTDVPEGESLAFGTDGYDTWRIEAAGRDVGGRRILSDECCAFFGGAYNTPWQQMLRELNGNYAGGVNQVVIHGFAYKDAPGAGWPGFAAFSPLFGTGFAEAWGPRQPTWTHMRDIADYLGREQEILRRGRNSVDVAIYRQEFDTEGSALGEGGAPYFRDQGLAQAGFTYGFVSHGLLARPQAVVRHRRLAPEGPAYKALVLNQQSTIPVRTAEGILRYAMAGLPVIVVGDLPSRVPGLDRGGEDARVQQLMGRLLAQRSVEHVAAEADVPEALDELEVSPNAAYESAAGVLQIRRVDKQVSYAFLFNPGMQPENVRVAFRGDGAPVHLDAWTGESRPIAEYRRHHGRVSVDVRLAPAETTLIAIPHDHGRDVHAVFSEADEVLRDRHDLRIRDTAAGTYTTVLDDGRRVTARIASVPASQSLGNWHLTVEDWRPGSSPTETIKVKEELDLTTLRPWTEIPGVEDTSGIGTYTTRVPLGSAWSGGYGAYLRLGEVYDTVRVRVNGKHVGPVDQTEPVIDVGRYLRRGTNTIEVDVATTLANRLRVARPADYGTFTRQPYGLVGPVQLVPYGEAALQGRR